MAPLIFLDDADIYSILGPQWQRFTNSTGSHNSTTTVCKTELNGKSARLIDNPRLTIPIISQSGFALIGTGAEGLVLNYTFRDAETHRQAAMSSEKDQIGKAGVKLWSLDTAESYALQVYPDAGNFSLDYVLVTPVEKTGLQGRTLMLDDHDEFIKYSGGGQWTPSESVSLPKAIPMSGTLNKANAVGASFDLQFTGANIAVFGVLNSVAGTLGSSYAIDNGSATSVTHFDGTQKVNNDDWLSSQLFFRENVNPGTHTLTVTLTEVTGNQSFYLDYITFQGTDRTQLNSTKEGAKKSMPLGGIIGVAIAVFILLGCCGTWGKKKYYTTKVVYVKETVYR